MSQKTDHLLDTHTLLWAASDLKRLSPTVRELLQERRYAVSCASFWELVLKRNRRTTLVRDPDWWWRHYVEALDIPVLSIDLPAVQHLQFLPDIHQDPFDHILICQAQTTGLRLVSSDKTIRRYLNTVW